MINRDQIIEQSRRTNQDNQVEGAFNRIKEIASFDSKSNRKYYDKKIKSKLNFKDSIASKSLILQLDQFE